jgi:hypothetical protein
MVEASGMPVSGFVSSSVKVGPRKIWTPPDAPPEALVATTSSCPSPFRSAHVIRANEPPSASGAPTVGDVSGVTISTSRPGAPTEPARLASNAGDPLRSAAATSVTAPAPGAGIHDDKGRCGVEDRVEDGAGAVENLEGPVGTPHEELGRGVAVEVDHGDARGRGPRGEGEDGLGEDVEHAGVARRVIPVPEDADCLLARRRHHEVAIPVAVHVTDGESRRQGPGEVVREEPVVTAIQRDADEAPGLNPCESGEEGGPGDGLVASIAVEVRRGQREAGLS